MECCLLTTPTSIPPPDPCGSWPGLRAHVVLLPQAVPILRPRTSTLDVSVCSWAQWAMGAKGVRVGRQQSEQTDFLLSPSWISGLCLFTRTHRIKGKPDLAGRAPPATEMIRGLPGALRLVVRAGGGAQTEALL